MGNIFKIAQLPIGVLSFLFVSQWNCCHLILGADQVLHSAEQAHMFPLAGERNTITVYQHKVKMNLCKTKRTKGKIHISMASQQLTWSSHSATDQSKNLHGIGVRQVPGRPRFKSPLCHGSSLDDLGPVTASLNLFYKLVALRIK